MPVNTMSLLNNTMGREIKSKDSCRSSYISVATGVVFFGNLLFWAAALLSRGKVMDNYFFVFDQYFFGKDFSLPICLSAADNPWEAGLNYPAGAVVFFRAVSMILGPASTHISNIDAIQFNFYSIIGMIGCLYFGVAILGYYILKVTGSKILPLLLCGSGPVLYGVMCGNNIILVVGLVLIFLLLYENAVSAYRWIGYIALAIATSIKLYPAVFCLLLLRERRYADFLRLVAICAGLTLLPFFVFFNGWESVADFLTSFFSESTQKADWGVGYNYSIQNMVKMISALAYSYVHGSITPVIKLAVLAMAAVMALLVRERWMSLFWMALPCLWFPDYSYTYMLPLLLPALVELISRSRPSVGPDRPGVAAVVGISLLFVPIPLPMIDFVNDEIFASSGYLIYPLSWGYVIQNVIILCICGGSIFSLLKSLTMFRGSDRAQNRKVRHANDAHTKG